MFDKFIKLINRHGNLNNPDIVFLRKHSRVAFYKKGEMILNEGKIVKDIYFVIDGCVRLYYNVDGKDKTAFFYNEGNFIWATKSLRHEIPTQKNYEAIEDTILIQIDRTAMQDLMETSQQFELITRISKEEELISYQQLVESFVTLSPKERFLNLMDTNRILFQRVPQQFIASYLGVTSETLSRIKKRVYACA